MLSLFTKRKEGCPVISKQPWIVLRKWVSICFWGIILISMTGANAGLADTSTDDLDMLDPGLEQIMEGFEDEEVLTESQTDPDPDDTRLSWLDMGGYLRMGSTYNYALKSTLPPITEQQGWSDLYGEFGLDAKIWLNEKLLGVTSFVAKYNRIFALKGQDKFTADIINSDETEVEIHEAFILGEITPSMDVKIGRQIMVWGTSDIIRVTDVLNPLDLREPGIEDLDAIRLPATMSRVDFYQGQTTLTLAAIHEIRFNQNPVYGSEFYPFNTPLPSEVKPATSLDNTEFAISIGHQFENTDIWGYAARIYHDQAHMVLRPGENGFSLHMEHAKLHMAGMAAQTTLGNWLFKGEAAWLDGLRFFNDPDKFYTRWDYLMGLEYFGFNQTHIIIEMANRHLDGYESRLNALPDGAIRDDVQMVLRFNRTFLNETLTLDILGGIFGLEGENGTFQRIFLEYDINDHWKIKTGLAIYQSGDKIETKHIGDNDRVWLSLIYHF